jgi:DNA-binding IclR family transcriptional regulator
MHESDNYNIKVLGKALRIMDILKHEKAPLRANELARRSSINVTTTFRILKTLQNYGWAFKNDEDKYLAGVNLSFSSDQENFYLILKDVAYCTMRRLTLQEGEVMNLAVRQNDKSVLLQQSRTSRITDYVAEVGTVHPLYATANGKILLSELPEKLLQGLLEIMDFKAYTEHTITEPTRLLKELEQVRKRGYALDICESLQNASCIAVAIRDTSHNIIASLSFSGFINGLTPQREVYYYEILNQASAEITNNLFQIYYLYRLK